MHVSDIKKFLRCKRLYKLSSEDQNSKPFPFYNICTDISESIKNKLHIDNYASGIVNETNEDTFAKMDQYNWIFNGRFEYNGLRVKIPLLHIIDKNKFDLYYICCSIHLNEEEFINITASKYVLKNLNCKINNIYMIYLNEDYIRDEILDDEQLWIVTDTIEKECGTKKIKDCLKKYSYDFDDLLNKMNNYQLEVANQRQQNCSGKKRCKYYEECFPDKVVTEDNSIMTLVSSRFKEKMYDMGIRYLKDADLNLIEANRVQYSQIMADKLGGLFVDQFALAGWLNDFKYPLSFLDFEWDLYPIPPYKMMKPMDVLLFQYSLHIYDGNELQHFEYIGENDDRQQLLESLLNAIPDEGSVLAYNATGAEKLRLKELAEYFPQYSSKINSILDRMVDIALPFITGVVYDVRMRGNFTLKTIENMIDEEHSYDDLTVGNGMQAVEIHRLMEKTTEQEKQNYYNQLYDYCGLDSYSLYKLYLWLDKISNR